MDGIPRILMQTWKDTNIPDRWKPSVRSIHEKMIPRGWQWNLMTDDDNRNFVATHFPYFLKTYDNFKYPIQRADAIRACYLYINGGVYMDMDFEIQEPLGNLFTKGSDIGLYVVSSGNLSGMYTNAFMASIPKHPFWLDYIDEMMKPVPWYGIGKHLHVMLSTGPMALTRALQKTQYPFITLPSALVTPCSVCDLTCTRSESSYLKQLEGGSWNGIDSIFYNWFLCNWPTIVLTVVLVIIVIIILLLVTRSCV